MPILPTFTPPDFEDRRLREAPDASIAVVERDGIAPENFHATSMYPEYFKIGGEWKLIQGSRMDCVPVIRENGEIEATEIRRLHIGDRVVVGRSEDGSEGIYLHTNGFRSDGGADSDRFAFRSGRSRETSFTDDYERLAALLRHDKAHGHIVWVLGPATIFDRNARKAMQSIIENGYCHAVLGGNAVATHDLEAAMFNTALGQDLDTGMNVAGGHYHHLDLMNRVSDAGSVKQAIEKYGLKDGLICTCVKEGVPFVLAGSIRDDGPLPEVICDSAEVQIHMRKHTGKATTIVCLATQLHTIAVGNLTPCYTVTEEGVRPTYIFAVDVSEFVLNKLRDRGSLEATTIVANIQDFLYKLTSLLGT
ncbi:MAG: hypothetical protein LBQ21_06930 [Clostridiales Family XIII bacterium]|jgi:lysine-ketoglutarate reductase/saccharopine dehydrogenase-like protein (TIGR00300 family)|nr:hypothetical protein [Clostridiales Family XIII bacterium]